MLYPATILAWSDGVAILKTGNLAVFKTINFIAVAYTTAVFACSVASVKAAETYAFEKFAVQPRYSGEIYLPDFNDRDREFASYRTRIRYAVRNGANFAGRYSVMTIGCGTDCSFGYIIDVSTGKVRELPRGGEEFMDLRYDYRIDSALIVARWRSLDTGRCYDETFVWQKERFDQIDKKDVGNIDFCLASWPTK
jgi:hypothetical protein